MYNIFSLFSGCLTRIRQLSTARRDVERLRGGLQQLAVLGSQLDYNGASSHDHLRRRPGISRRPTDGPSMGYFSCSWAADPCCGGGQSMLTKLVLLTDPSVTLRDVVELRRNTLLL